MEKISYNMELFDVLRDLVPISNSVIIRKENNQIVVRRTDSEVTVMYSLKAPVEYFDFPAGNDDVTFYNYAEFYQYLKSMNEPEVYVDNKTITIKKNNSNLIYVLANPESFEKKTPKEPSIGDGVISFNLSSTDLDEMVRMITLIKPKKARIIGDSKKIKIVLFDNMHDNQFEKSFKPVEQSGDKKADFLIFSSTFSNIPAKRDYTFNIKPEGFVKISLLNNKMNLDVYTGKVNAN